MTTWYYPQYHVVKLILDPERLDQPLLCYDPAMKLMLAALIVALCATVVVGATPVAGQEPPVGEIRIVPSAGPVGTVVKIWVDFDRDITQVTFWCINRDTFEEGSDFAVMPDEVSASFALNYTIPAELTVKQGNGAMLSPLIAECEFRAEAGHQHASASVPFTVTEAAVMPSTGFAPQPHSPAGASTAVVFLAIVGVALGLLGWRYRREIDRYC